MFVLINPTQWPSYAQQITEQAYLQLGIDQQVLYEAADQDKRNYDRGFLLDNGETNPGFGLDPAI
jgi:hypothetical protein